MLKLYQEKKVFKLDIVGYQFLSLDKDSDYDWLQVKVFVADDESNWSATDCCLTAKELYDLRGWFAGLNSGNNIVESLSFLEGELEFEYSPKDKQLTIILDFSFHPKGENYDYSSGEEPYKLTYDFDEDLISSVLVGIDILIKNYPQR